MRTFESERDMREKEYYNYQALEVQKVYNSGNTEKGGKSGGVYDI